jgi:hypothetical protein
LSEDNKNLMALFSTKYHKPQSTRIWKTADRIVETGKGLAINYDYWSDRTPFYISAGGCPTCSNLEYYGNNYADMY